MLRIFFNSNGLRAGWSVLLFAAIFEGTEFAETSLLRQLVALKPSGPIPLALAFPRECCELIAVVVATWVMAHIERQKLLFYGLQGNRKILLLGAGAVWGFLGLSILIGLLWRSGALVFQGKLLNGAVAWEYAFGWLLVFFIVGLFEESLLRGYLQNRLAGSVGFWWAAIGLSIAFSLLHLNNRGESFLGLLTLVTAGLAFCMSLWYTKSLWWAIGFHTGWDWGESYIYGTPNSGLIMEGHLFTVYPAGNPLWSGGSAGPEASLLMLPLFVLAGLGMWIWWGRRSSAFDN